MVAYDISVTTKAQEVSLYHGNGGYFGGLAAARNSSVTVGASESVTAQDHGTKTKGKLQFLQMLRGVWYANMEQIKLQKACPLKQKTETRPKAIGNGGKSNSKRRQLFNRHC